MTKDTAIVTRITEVREEMGLSKYRVAKDTDIPRSTYGRIESGESQPSVERGRRLFYYFNRKVDLSLIYDPLFTFEDNNA